MIAIYKRDLKALYKTPVGYVFSGTLLLLFYVLFYVFNVYTAQTADVSVVMGNLIYWLFLPVPILTMRLVTEEYRQKTDQLLLTAPVGTFSIVMGKFLAGMASILITVVLSLAIPIIISVYGELLGWTMFGNYLALIYLDDLANLTGNASVVKIANSISPFMRFQSFAYGQFSLGDLIYYVSVAALFLFLASRVLEKKRYS